jgi:hypothetical protein
MEKRYLDYIDDVVSRIDTDSQTKNKIKQSLTEHIEALIEKHGSLAYNKLDPVEKVAWEFSENLQLQDRKEYSYPWPRRYPVWRRVSQKKIFNIPLYHITDGYNPETGEFEIARGIFAFGPVALGVFTAGGIALGVFSFAGISAGVLLALGGLSLSALASLGGAAVAGLFAAGGMAVSFGLSIGGFAVGHIAIGGEVFGEYIYKTTTGEGNAVEWFRNYLPYFVKFFQ